MGFFGSWVYDGGVWRDFIPASVPQTDGPWLWVDIHDSSLTLVTYHPATQGSGSVFLGHTAHAYFDDDAITTPGDVAVEAAGLADWWALLRGGADGRARAAKAEELVPYLAHDGAGWRPPVFVEPATIELLNALDVPLPDDLLN